MKLKPGVRVPGLSAQMVLAAMIVRDCYGDTECIVTSANDSTHSQHSLHYLGRALDFRTKNYPGSRTLLRNNVAAALGDDFDVVLEDVGGENEHLHVEYDPK